MSNSKSNDEFNLEKFYTMLVKHKWLIIIIMLLSTILMAMNLYFKPSTYRTNSIIEIKSKSKSASPNDFLLNALSMGSSGKVEKEIEILRTYLVQKDALERVNFQVSYFKNRDYRKIELYNNSPISLKKIAVLDKHYLGKDFILTPKKNGFTLQLKESIIKRFIFNAHAIIDNNKLYRYDEPITTEAFEFTVHQNRQFSDPIIFHLNGTNREIYDKMMQKKLNISQINQAAPLINISFDDTIPKRAENYVNAIMESFINQSINSKNEQSNKILAFINGKLDEIRSELQHSENKLEDFKVAHNVIAPLTQSKKFIEKLSEIEIELSENSLQQKLVTNLLTFARNNKNLDAIAPSLMQLNDKPTLQLITTLQSLQITKANLLTELTEAHPKVITVKKQMQHIRQKIIYNIKNLRALIQQQSKSLEAEKRSYEAKIQKLPTKEKNLVNMQRDYKVSSTLYNYLLKKKTESELLIVSTLSDYKIIDKAHTIEKEVKPKRTLMMVVAPLIGLFLSVIFSTILESLNSKISNKKELLSVTDLPLYGIIPELKKKELKVEIFDEKNIHFTESYRSLRTNLPIKKANGEANIIVITSTIAEEGKTTITANLAGVCQMAGNKSIILNLDLRKPTLHTYFNLSNQKGMSSYLAGKESIQDIIFATKYTDLHVITSGPVPSNPSELILSSRLNELLDILKQRYDYIFIDSAPIGLVSDSLVLMKRADMNLVVFRENYAEKSFIESLHNLIEKNRLNNIGLVLNRSKSKNSRNEYGYGYGY